MKTSGSRPPNFAALCAGMFFTLAASSAFPCAVCFGDPSSPLVKGAKMGVIFLGLMVYGVLGMFGGFAYFCWKRAGKLAAEEAARENQAADAQGRDDK